MAKNLCVICKKDSGIFRVCASCQSDSIIPCPDCGKPTPQITVMGKARKNKTCVACTSSAKADTHKIGRSCAVCGIRSANIDFFYQLCKKCASIKSTCPICKGEMPKYIKRGGIRKYCSAACSKKANPTPSESIILGQIKRFANHVYKSHQNKIARSGNEYKEWRKAVYERDNYTCQKCGLKSGNGKAVELHPHHIKPFATFPELRFEVSNGITLCKDCHRKEHKHIFIGKTKKSPSV